MAISVFDDKRAICCVIINENIQDYFYNDLVAYNDEDSVSVISTHQEDKFLFYRVSYTEFLDKNGDAAGTDTDDTVNYLNQQFQGLGEGGTPSIISPSSSTAIVGELYNFQLESDLDINFWTESGLPDGLYLNQSSGQVTGTLSAGATASSPYTVNYAAVGIAGVGTQSHTLSVTFAPSFANNNSVKFTRNRYTFCNGQNGSDLFFQRNTAFSVSLWFRKTSNQDGVLYSRQDSLGDGFKVWVDSQGSNRYLTFTLQSGSNKVEFRGSTNITNNVWRHVVVTYDGSENTSGAELYINGSAESKNNQLNQSLSDFTQSTSYVYLGGRRSFIPSLPSDRMSGNIDEVSVWDKELSSAEVTSIYNSGTPDDLSLKAFYSDAVEWWRMGDGDTFPTLTGQKSVQNLTMTNMVSSDIVTEIP